MTCPHCGAPVVDVTSLDSREPEYRYSPDFDEMQDFIARSILAGRGPVYEAIAAKFDLRPRAVR